MIELKRANFSANRYPEKIIQFGDGNFLRGFVEWIVWTMNEKANFNASVVVVKPRPGGSLELLDSQDGLYHLNLQGVQNGEEVDRMELMDVISRGLNPYQDFDAYLQLAENPEIRFVVSNTTEAGIVFDPDCSLEDKPGSSFPAKLTQLLFHRYQYFHGAADKGLMILPCELIFHNGVVLKKCIEQHITAWELDEGFRYWFQTACAVYSTLVDRIVPGFPKDSIDELWQRVQVKDQLLVQSEIYHLWVIEAPASLSDEFPADKAGLNVHFVPDEKPYHERKVTLLNAPHTLLAPVGYLSGLDTVKEIVEHEVLGQYVRKAMFDELMITLELPKDELIAFGEDVLERFRNPFVKHFVTSIMLNSFAKFRARELPALKIYLEKTGKLPSTLVLGLAGIITCYKGDSRGENTVGPNDDPVILGLVKELWSTGCIDNLVTKILSFEFIWGEDLNLISGLNAQLSENIKRIQEIGMLETVKLIL